ncbi:MAG: amino acid adenylation domain-containing protein, partial [Bacteroidota bacterium]
LSEVQSGVLACFEHQEYPYEELIDALRLERTLNRHPLFDVMLAYQNFEASSLELPDLTLSSYPSAHKVSKFDLVMIVTEVDDELSLSFGYSTELFKEETIKRFAHYFKNLVKNVISTPSAHLSALEVMGQKERRQLLEDFNATTAEYPHDKSLITLFEQQVKVTPKNIALVFHQTRVSYQQLNERANQVARCLTNKSALPGEVIGLMLERSVEMIIGMLGIMKAGCAYLPLDPGQPEQRICTMLEDCGVRLTFAEQTNNLYDQYTELVDIRDEAIQRQSKEDLGIELPPDGLAYVIYTSGSTGKPKGVKVGHRSVVNLIYSQAAMFGIDQTDRILQFSTILFDASVEQIWLALLKGSSLILIDRESLINEVKFNDYISNQKVTHLHTTPSFLGSIRLRMPNSLKRVLAGGEVCAPLLAQKFWEDYTFYNEYGPTEATVTSVICEVTEDVYVNRNIPIGVPIKNTSVYLLAKDGTLLPKGVKGELFIGGDGLALGYMNDEKLTKESFIPNPFHPGGRLYRTGDLARWSSDGALQFLGRQDDQVKIRGFRIELGEIEHQLATHDQLQEVVVMSRELEGEKHLVAYYVSEEPLSPDVMRSYLLNKLPDYMLPGYYVHLDRFPLNSSGKVNRKALPSPEVLEQDNYEPASNELEHKLVAIWSEVLKLDPGTISVTKSFFELGGHSLRAAVMVNSIIKSLHVEVPLTVVFSSPTIKLIAQKISHIKATNSLRSDDKLVLISQNMSATVHNNLFMVHDGSGDVHSYIELAASIDKYNCWGLRYDMLNPYAPQNVTIEDLAQKYIERIQKIQPKGPYHILGWSVGGLIAYEIVRQLELMDKEVEKLFIIDAQLPLTKKKTPNAEKPHFSLREEKKFIMELLSFENEQIEAHDSIEDLWTWVVNRFEELDDNGLEMRSLVPETFYPLIPHYKVLEPKDLATYVNTIRTLDTTILNYQLGKNLNTSLVYIKARNSEVNTKGLLHYFNEKVIYREIAGDHFSIFQQPMVNELIKTVLENLYS